MNHCGARLWCDLGDVLHIVGKAPASGGVGQDGVAVLLGQLAIGDAGLRRCAFGQHGGEVCGGIEPAQDRKAVLAEKAFEIVERSLAEDAEIRIDADLALHALWRARLRTFGNGARGRGRAIG